MKEEIIIKVDGKEVDITKLSDEELMKLHKKVKSKIKKYKNTIEEYEEKYPFLKNDNN